MGTGLSDFKASSMCTPVAMIHQHYVKLHVIEFVFHSLLGTDNFGED